MRALRKEPQHRYNSIEQLASDVRRYLAREPVQARQGNWLYYSQRFIRRHAFGVTAARRSSVFIIAFAIAMSDADAADRRGTRSRQSRKVRLAQKRLDLHAEIVREVHAAGERTAEEVVKARELLERGRPPNPRRT